MKPGSVIVDLAVEQGGNCPLSKLGEVVEEHGVMIIGHANMPSRVAIDASALYAKNLLNFVSPLIAEGGTSLSVDMEDEIVKGTLVTNAGEIVHDSVLAIPESASKPKRAAAKAAAD
jgi:NAD(P) transhydrogenase subunit alpha